MQWGLLLTGGQRADSTQAIALLEGFAFDAVLADRGYDTDKLLDFLAQHNAVAIISAKKIAWCNVRPIGTPTRRAI
jgi:hypothetical protein